MKSTLTLDLTGYTPEQIAIEVPRLLRDAAHRTEVNGEPIPLSLYATDGKRVGFVLVEA